MTDFDSVIDAWGTDRFETEIKHALTQMAPEALPLQQGLRATSYALDAPIETTILKTERRGDKIRVKAGVFYTGIVTGCSCADDPTPIEPQNEYCEILLELDVVTLASRISLLG